MAKNFSVLKICWDTVNHIVLMPGYGSNTQGRLVYYKDPLARIGSKGEFFESDDPCKQCNEYFLKKKTSKSEFCSNECKAKYKKEHTVEKEPDGRLKENGGGQWRIGKSAWNRGLKTSIPEGCVSYKHYNPLIDWFAETRPDPKDPRILQTKCCVCSGWHRPTRDKVKLVLKFVNGIAEKDVWGFYCSEHCQKRCPHFGKSVKTIMREDAFRAGRIKYSEFHRLPDKVIHYNWQDDLKKVQDKLRKPYERKKLRRRKKRESELIRMRAKRERKKRKQEHLASDEYKKEQHLKRMLYRARQRSKQKQWKYNLTYEWLQENTPDKCPKCGIPFRYDPDRNMDPFGPSIDRLDPTKGYTKDNCQITSWIYNCGKNCYDDLTLYIICKAALKNFRPRSNP